MAIHFLIDNFTALPLIFSIIPTHNYFTFSTPFGFVSTRGAAKHRSNQLILDCIKGHNISKDDTSVTYTAAQCAKYISIWFVWMKARYSCINDVLEQADTVNIRYVTLSYFVKNSFDLNTHILNSKWVIKQFRFDSKAHIRISLSVANANDVPKYVWWCLVIVFWWNALWLCCKPISPQGQIKYQSWFYNVTLYGCIHLHIYITLHSKATAWLFGSLCVTTATRINQPLNNI